MRTFKASQDRSASPFVNQVLRAHGKSLPLSVLSFFEGRFGHDFSQVRVHDGEQALNAAQVLGARAFTIGRNLVFDQGQFAPTTRSGQKLLAHELAHIVQQKNAEQNSITEELPVSQPGDPFEQEADHIATRTIAGEKSAPSLRSGRMVIQCAGPTDTGVKEEEKKEPGEVIVDGLKTVAEQAKDNNPQVKKVILDPLEEKLKGKWKSLSTGEQATLATWGAGTVSMLYGAMLSDPNGRKQLEGLNLATPLKLIPKMPLDTFKYTLPSADQPLYQFETGFDASDLLNMRTEARGLPEMSLKVNMRWAYDPASRNLRITGGDASIGLVPGLTLSGGVYTDILRQPPTYFGSEGQMVQSKESIPEYGKPRAIPDVRFMINVDLLKFKPGDLIRQFKGFF